MKPRETTTGTAIATALLLIAKPGITVLGSHRKWVPPSGDKRAAELIARPILEQNLNRLAPPVMDSHLYSFSLFDLLSIERTAPGRTPSSGISSAGTAVITIDSG